MVSDDIRKYVELCKERKAIMDKTGEERSNIDARREGVGQRLLNEKGATAKHREGFMSEVRVMTSLLEDRVVTDLRNDLIKILRPVFKNCRSSTTKVIVDSDKVRLVQPMHFSQYDFECPDIVMGTFGIGLRRNKQSRSLDDEGDFAFVVAHLPMVIGVLKRKYPQLASSLDDVVPDVGWFGKLSRYTGMIVRFDQPFWFTDEGGIDRLASAVFIDRTSINIFSYVKEDGVFKYALSQAYPGSANGYFLFEQIDKDQMIVGMRDMKKWFTKDADGKIGAEFAIERTKEKLKRWLVLSSL